MDIKHLIAAVVGALLSAGLILANQKLGVNIPVNCVAPAAVASPAAK